MEMYIESVKEQTQNFKQHALTILRNEKKIHGDTNKDVANRCGMSEDAVKYLLSKENPPKDPRLYPIIRISMSYGLDLNYVFGYTPPQKAETSVVTPKEDYYVSDIIMLSDKRVEDVKAMCEVRLKDKDETCELRLADNNAMWEARYNDLKEMMK
jgi:transcriptional regulator with XRE-family HTH domain